MSLQLFGSGLTGFKEPLTKFSDVRRDFAGILDIHSWCEVDSSVSDYPEDSEAFNGFKRQNKLTGEMIRVRMPHQEEQKAFRSIYTKILKKKFKWLIQQNDPILIKGALLFWMETPGNCFMRAYIVAKIAGLISVGYLKEDGNGLAVLMKNPAMLLDKSIPVIGMRFGSAGWKEKASTGRVWYEYG